MAWLQVDFYSNVLQQPVPLQILIPADYADPKQEKKWKTLYLLHGYFGNCSDWLLSGDAAAVSQEYDLCIVMPSGNNDFYVDAPCGARDNSRFLAEELVGFTRRLLPLSDRREDTLLGGLSMGGFGTLYNCFAHSDVFGHGIALSSALILEDEGLSRVTDDPSPMGVTRGYYRDVFGEDLSALPDSELNPRNTAAAMVREGRPFPDLYIACGRNDMLKYPNRALCRSLDALGVPYTYEEGPGTHEWFFWKPYLRRGLDHALGGPNPSFPNPFWVDDEKEGEDAWR